MPKATPTPPEKPRADFALFAHNNGQWAKKVKGKLLYFGTWDNPPCALGRVPRKRATAGGLTLADLCDQFHLTKLAAMDTGELSPHSDRDYVHVCGSLIEAFGKDHRAR